MRGKVSKCPPVDFFHRITPAYAGKSGSGNFSARSGRDHPRLCGEKGAAGKDLQRSGGSPPPMRGKDANASKAIADHGITPAYAGKSPGFCLDSPPLKDHPRLCGEKETACFRHFPLPGSPPPMRGKDGFPLLEALVLGITPAYAGKSSWVTLSIL